MIEVTFLIEHGAEPPREVYTRISNLLIKGSATMEELTNAVGNETIYVSCVGYTNPGDKERFLKRNYFDVRSSG